jgi:hypothetical protein
VDLLMIADTVVGPPRQLMPAFRVVTVPQHVYDAYFRTIFPSYKTSIVLWVAPGGAALGPQAPSCDVHVRVLPRDVFAGVLLHDPHVCDLLPTPFRRPFFDGAPLYEPARGDEPPNRLSCCGHYVRAAYAVRRNDFVGPGLRDALSPECINELVCTYMDHVCKRAHQSGVCSIGGKLTLRFSKAAHAAQKAKRPFMAKSRKLAPHNRRAQHTWKDAFRCVLCSGLKRLIANDHFHDDTVKKTKRAQLLPDVPNRVDFPSSPGDRIYYEVANDPNLINFFKELLFDRGVRCNGCQNCALTWRLVKVGVESYVDIGLQDCFPVTCLYVCLCWCVYVFLCGSRAAGPGTPIAW